MFYDIAAWSLPIRHESLLSIIFTKLANACISDYSNRKELHSSEANSSMKLLIAEDDKSVCEMLQMFFQKEALDATFVHDGLSATRCIQEEHWDLIILDWMLPFKDGITLCKEIRANYPTPIILLTARNQEHDRITGLEIGADDYVTKPFSPLELLARIKAVVRRYHISLNIRSETTANEDKESDGRLVHQNISVDPATREVNIDDRTLYNLTPKEFDLLCQFIKHPKKVFTREQLLESVWGYDYYGEERTVDVHIKRLRSKVSTTDKPLIVTVWGVGYKLEE
jgi:two-component system OmpR family response regulator